MQETNCHPFRHGRWLFVHNGFIADFHVIRRDLMLAIDPALFAEVTGSTDTEVVFYLALTFGLEDDPIQALERTIGFIESVAGRHGVADAVQGSFGVSDGTTLWAVRYATNGKARSLFTSAEVDSVRRLYPDNPRIQALGADDRVIVSEPFSDLPGLWNEVPEATAVTVRHRGELKERPFRPIQRLAKGFDSCPHRRTSLLTEAEITEREQRQIDRANSSGKTPVVFIHGLWLLPSSWDNWVGLFEENGYAGVTPSWPDDPESVEEARANPEVFAKKTLKRVADHTADVIGQLDKKPAVMGHSTGGLLAQMIADRGLSAATVAIDPGRSAASCRCRSRR